ncbi:MAG: hypothetical protein U0736_11840 [Gemmataceae bacterium]
MNRLPTVLRVSLAVVSAYAAATAAAVLTLLLWSGSLETIGVGLLVPLGVAFALLGYALTLAWPGGGRWSRVLYLVLVLPLLVVFGWVVLFPSAGASADGADQMALALLLPLVAAGVAGFVTLELWQRNHHRG